MNHFIVEEAPRDSLSALNGYGLPGETPGGHPVFDTVAHIAGGLAVQEFSAARLTIGGVGYSTNGHRTAANRLVPDAQLPGVSAQTLLQRRQSRPITVNDIPFGTGQPEGGKFYIPDKPLGHEMNARLLVPNGMAATVDHNGDRLPASERPRLSAGSIIRAARAQFDTMAKRYPRFPVTQAKAVDDVLRRSAWLEREEDVPAEVAIARQHGEVPSTINPEALYKKVLSDFRMSPWCTTTSQAAGSVIGRIDSPLNAGETVPLRTYYEAAKELLVIAWNQQDQARVEAILRGHAAIRHERSYLSAMLEHRGEMHRGMAKIAMSGAADTDKMLPIQQPYAHY